MNIANKIVEEILSIPGQKILTLNNGNSFDIEENGYFEYIKPFKNFILTSNNLGIVVRQFTNNYIKKLVPSGKILDIPIKNIYMIIVIKGKYFWLRDEEVFENYYMDSKNKRNSTN